MTRDRVVALASAEVGSSDPAKYWRDVLAQPWHGAYPRHWCGAFALWCLRQAELTDWHWEVGKGFLWRLPRTKTPEPGDIGYVDQPFQHHYVIADAGKHTLTSVDGNQGSPGVQERHRAVAKDTYFSIAPLLRADTMPSLPRWDDETEPGPPKHPTLRLGAKHEAVKVVQQALNRHGAQLVVDGQFGRLTALAVQSLQRRAGLDSDGVVGPKTWAVLEQL